MPEPSTPPTRLYDTLSKSLRPVTPANPARVTFYTCGPTVYDDAHIGNFRSFLAADLLRRWLESPLCTLTDDEGKLHAGPREVVHVMNITDVGHMTDDDVADGSGEDKMAVAGRRIAEAKKSGKLPPGVDVDPNDPRAIASFYAGRFIEDAKALGLKVAADADQHPERMPRATDNIEGMVSMIEALATKGFAYRAGDAVYFDVQKYRHYGELSGNTLDKLRGGAGGRVSDEHQAAKHHPADFLLWKADPTHLMRWPGPVIDAQPVGEGYPGWHIECSVMARSVLGDVIDLHSGGEDNIFPHHECERAQSCCFTGHDQLARHWFHPRFLMVEGAKMSKSRGTFYTPRDLFEQDLEPAAVRLELIKTHYRSNADFSMQGLKDSARRIARWRRLAASVRFGSGVSVATLRLGSVARDFALAISEDLNIAAALGRLDSEAVLWDQFVELMRNSGKELDVEAGVPELPTEPMPAADAWRLYKDNLAAGGKPATLAAEWAAIHLIDNVLGVIFTPQPQATATEIGVYQGVKPTPEVEALLGERASARKTKDYARADAIRDQLAAMGLSIKDIAGGKVEVSRG